MQLLGDLRDAGFERTGLSVPQAVPVVDPLEVRPIERSRYDADVLVGLHGDAGLQGLEVRSGRRGRRRGLGAEGDLDVVEPGVAGGALDRTIEDDQHDLIIVGHVEGALLDGEGLVLPGQAFLGQHVAVLADGREGQDGRRAAPSGQGSR